MNWFSDRLKQCLLKCVITTFFLLYSFLSGAQTTCCGMWYDSLGVYSFAQVNTSTSQLTFSSPLSNITTLVAWTAVVNPISNMYVVKGSINPYRYYSIDISTGAIINDTTAQADIRMLRINPLNGNTYGLLYNGNYHFVSINTQTSQMTYIKQLTNVDLITSETAFLNPLTQEYIIRAHYVNEPPTKYRYLTIDVSSGILNNDTVAIHDIRLLQIHPSTGVVFGLFYSGSDYSFVSVNTLTGQMNIISLLNGVELIVSDSGVLDPSQNTYVFKGNYITDPGGIYRYFTVDIQTGQILTDPIVAHDIRMLRLCNGTTSITENSEIAGIKIYPNPFLERTLVQTTKDFQNATITIFNSVGQIVRQHKIISGKEFTIDRLNMKSGVYFIRIEQDSSLLNYQKLVLID